MLCTNWLARSYTPINVTELNAGYGQHTMAGSCLNGSSAVMVSAFLSSFIAL